MEQCKHFLPHFSWRSGFSEFTLMAFTFLSAECAKSYTAPGGGSLLSFSSSLSSLGLGRRNGPVLVRPSLKVPRAGSGRCIQEHRTDTDQTWATARRQPWEEEQTSLWV